MVPPAARRSALLLAALAIAVAPNLVWIWIDKTVWPWDPAWYGKHSVDLFVTLLHVVDRNASKTQPAKFVVFLIKDKGAPALVPVK